MPVAEIIAAGVGAIQAFGEGITMEGVTSDPGLEAWAEYQTDYSPMIDAPAWFPIHDALRDPQGLGGGAIPLEAIGFMQPAGVAGPPVLAEQSPQPAGIPSWALPVGAMVLGGLVLGGVAVAGIAYAATR